MSRRELLAAFDREEDASVRESVARALGSCANSAAVQRTLTVTLNDNDENPDVRQACAAALCSPAMENEGVRKALTLHLRNNVPEGIRAGAATGLTGCLGEHADLRDRLFRLLKNATTPEDLRVACLHALESHLPHIDGGIDVLKELLTGSSASKPARVSAQVLAEYAATGRVDWNKLPIGQIEQVLVSLENPCDDALDALRSLMDAREVRRLGITREERIKRALEAYRDGIETVFIFGSSARGEQSADSDIDLMVIGDVTLRELTPGLKNAERELGRQVNAVLYTRDEWQQRLAEGNPFVTRVHGGKKLFVMGGQDDLARVAR